MGMGMHKFVKKMGKVNPKNQFKTITPGKWLDVLPN